MGRSHDSWRRPSQDVSLDDLTGWRFGRSIRHPVRLQWQVAPVKMEIPMSSNAVLVGGNMFFNRKREGIDTKVVHMANRCLYCGRIAWANSYMLNINSNIETSFICSKHGGSIPNRPSLTTSPCIPRHLSEVAATPWPSWISCWQSWSFGRLTASKWPQFVCCLLKILLDQYLFRQCGETIQKNRLHLLSLDPRSSIDGIPISHGWL